jgi:heme exporter protein C
VFYPAVLGWTLIGVWFATLRIRLKKVRDIVEDIQINGN